MSNQTPSWNINNRFGIANASEQYPDNASNVTPTWNKLSLINEPVPQQSSKPYNKDFLNRSSSLQLDPQMQEEGAAGRLPPTLERFHSAQQQTHAAPHQRDKQI